MGDFGFAVRCWHESPVGGVDVGVMRKSRSAERAGYEIIVLKVFSGYFAEMGVLRGTQPIRRKSGR